jgi:hypothetical protein
VGVRLEIAHDVLGAVISHFAEQLGHERDAQTPRLDKINTAQQMIKEVKDIREQLDPADPEGIEKTIAWLSPYARHLFSTGAQTPEAQQRANQFEQTNASLGLEGLPMSLDDLVVQARVIDGTWTTEQAVDWYRERAKS